MVEGNQSQVPKVAGEGSHTYTISESPPINGKLPPDDRLTFPQTHPHSPHSRNGVKEKQTQPVMRSLPERRGWPWDAWEVQRTWSFVAVLRNPAPCPAAGQLPGVPFCPSAPRPCPLSRLSSQTLTLSAYNNREQRWRQLRHSFKCCFATSQFKCVSMIWLPEDGPGAVP